MLKLNPIRLLGLLARLSQLLLGLWRRFWGLFPLWLRAWFSAQARVRKDLSDRADEVDKLISEGGHCWMDHEVLIWDSEVRSILGRHLGPDHLARYQRVTALKPEEEEEIVPSATALERAQREILANIAAVQMKPVIPRGGLSDAWWFRTAVTAFVVASIGLLFDQVIIPRATAGGGPSVMEKSNATSGTTQNIVEDPGKVVEISPIPAPTPAETPLAVSEEPVIDIPAEPEEDQPIGPAEDNFLAGVTALEAGNFEVAVDKFGAAIEDEPGFVRAYYNLAVAYDNIGTEEANRAAVENYTAAIELWNSLESDGDGLLFEAKLGRGLLLVSFSTDEQAICLGRSDLLEYLERGDVSQRNTEAVNKALAGVEVDCKAVEEIS